jgi:hypothetical protein
VVSIDIWPDLAGQARRDRGVRRLSSRAIAAGWSVPGVVHLRRLQDQLAGPIRP